MENTKKNKELEELKLWERFFENKDNNDLRNELFLKYYNLVRIVASKVSMYFGENVVYEDLLAYGTEGLIDALNKFDLEKDVKFETYASLRIRGAMLDEVRKNDWIPRTVRMKEKEIRRIKARIESETGKPATDEEIAKELNLSLEEYFEMSKKLYFSLISLNDYLEEGNEIANDYYTSNHFVIPEKSLLADELKDSISKFLEVLTKREREVIDLYYYQDLSLLKIADKLGFSEGRACQLHKAAIKKLKPLLSEYMGFNEKEIV